MLVRLETLGCRLNLGEIHALGRALRLRGHRVVGPGQPADLVVLNSCTVTHVADRKSRKTLRRLRRNHPEAKLIVTGCFAAELADQASAAERVLALGADRVIDNLEKDRLLEHLEAEGLLPPGGASPDAGGLEDPRLSTTRAFLKAQDGCDQACSFCVVTLARGAARSVDPDALLAEVRGLLREGFQEIVLSGVHLGGYGKEWPGGPDLAGLVARILDETELPRLRLSSVEPWDLSPAFFERFAHPRLMPHLHLPLQSGSDRILKRMARRTSRERFSAIVAGVRAVRPDVAITSDLIVGFPGETEEDFAVSLELCERLGLAGLHVFPFSPREGTAAATFEGQILPELRETRMLEALALASRLEQRCWQASIGQERPVLWESFEESEEGRTHSGLTDHYQRVTTLTADELDLRGRVLPTRLTAFEPTGLVGTL
ncbi:MAG: MiaB/RimO family radical SAM methylthiotransferase [Deltaproteobacteria bacterium]|nr:MiaB/RimO family radical SAM methylthiotransferase [Deltaproteobacteria bacterium]